MAAKYPLKKGEAGTALVADATRAAAAGGEGEEGEGRSMKSPAQRW